MKNIWYNIDSVLKILSTTDHNGQIDTGDYKEEVDFVISKLDGRLKERYRFQAE